MLYLFIKIWNCCHRKISCLEIVQALSYTKGGISFLVSSYSPVYECILSIKRSLGNLGSGNEYEMKEEFKLSITMYHLIRCKSFIYVHWHMKYMMAAVKCLVFLLIFKVCLCYFIWMSVLLHRIKLNLYKDISDSFVNRKI